MAYTSCLTGCRSASQNDSPAPSLHAKVKVLLILAENFPKTEINPPPPPRCAPPHTKTRASPKYPVSPRPRKPPPRLQLAPDPLKPNFLYTFGNPKALHTASTQN